MLRFSCPHCSAKLTAREEQAGKMVVCPRCKGKITLSNPSEPEPNVPGTEDDLQLMIDPPKSLDGALLKLKDDRPADTVADKSRREEELRSSVLPAPSPEHTGARPLPWPIDIFLYPCSGPGLMILGIVIVIPLLLNLAAGLLGAFGFFLGMPVLLIDIVLSLYFLWYLTQCIADSAVGGVRAPETISRSPSLWDMLVQTGRTIACIAVALLPLMICWLHVRKMDATFWSLLGLAVAICPMALLAVTMYDSIEGLNPLILIASVFRTFLSYFGLVLVLGLMTFVIIMVKLAVADDFVLRFVVSNAEYYPMLIAAHLLGRFYWRNRERLDWVV